MHFLSEHKFKMQNLCILHTIIIFVLLRRVHVIRLRRITHEFPYGHRRLFMCCWCAAGCHCRAMPFNKPFSKLVQNEAKQTNSPEYARRHRYVKFAATATVTVTAVAFDSIEYPQKSFSKLSHLTVCGGPSMQCGRTNKSIFASKWARKLLVWVLEWNGMKWNGGSFSTSVSACPVAARVIIIILHNIGINR